MQNKNKCPPHLRLREARKEHGWSQPKLAELVGTTFVNISRWENGWNAPTPYYLQKLSEVLGKTPAELGLTPEEQQPARKWPIPVSRYPFFAGRESLLAELHQSLSATRAAALTQPHALYGLGGIGKTRAAVEYVMRHGDEYRRVFWIRAATRDTLLADFVALATALDLPEKKEPDQRIILTAVRRWLLEHNRWLLVLDDAEELTLTLALQYLPAHHNGYLLITTRLPVPEKIATSLEVKRLGTLDGALLLLHLANLWDQPASLGQVSAADCATAKRIVKLLEGLPLAIVQAGAFVQETGCGLTGYLDLYQRHRKELLARSSKLMHDHPETVATTWSLSFQQIEEANPAAAEVLRFCAFLAPDTIPEDLVQRGLPALGAPLANVATNDFQFNEALGLLYRYSLIQRDPTAHTLSLHRLVQAVLRESMDEDMQRAWAERTVRAVNAAFPDAAAGTGAHYQSYLPHVQECATLIDQYHLYFPEAARLLFQAGAFLYIHGFYPQSQSLHHQALAIRKQVFGSDHHAVAESLNKLGVLYRAQGDYEQAEGCHQQALAIREKALGLEHPATAESLNNLGVLYRNKGKYEDAKPLLQRALGIYKQSLGFEHHDTLMASINLARLFSEQRSYEEAESLLQQALATSERALEPEHSFIAHILNLLARLYYEQRNYERAETLWKQSLAMIEESLGPDHPITAERFHDLAEFYAAQGRYTEAQSLCQRAVSICEKRLGLEHPDTIAYRKFLTGIESKSTRR